MSIALRHISLAYGDRRLLEDVSADFAPQTLTALIGRNGTGKSTLLRAIAGLGPVRIANLPCRDVVALGRAPYTDWIGRMQAADRAAVDRALELVGMSAFARKTMDRMSDGECQRVMIARALAQDTPVILLDEPTAFLDLPNRYELASLLRRLARDEGKCILFSTHDLDIALSLCDAVALIDTPSLHLLPAGAMARSGLIERLFAGESARFDPETRTVKLR